MQPRPLPPPRHGITEEISAHVQLRVLSAEDAGGHGEAARHLEAADPAQAQVLLRHLRRRRLDARPHAGGGARNPERRRRCRAAPVLRRLDARRPRRHAGAVPLAWPAPYRRAARRPALGRGRRGRTALCQRTGGIHPPDHRRSFPHRSRRLSGVPPAGALGPRRPARVQAQGRRRRKCGDHPVFFQRRRLFPLRRRLRGAGHRAAYRARHHADRQFLAARAVLGCLRRGDSALAAAAAAKLRRRRRLDPQLRPGRGHRTVRPTAVRRARRACTSTP